MYILGANITF